MDKQEGKGQPTYNKKKGRLSGLVTSCRRTAFWNTLLKERQEGQKDEEEDVNSY